MSNSDLRERAQRIARLEDQKHEITEDIKAEYAAAKSVGHNPTALRKAIRVHHMSAEKRARYDSDQCDIELYLAALDIRETEMREAAE